MKKIITSVLMVACLFPLVSQAKNVDDLSFSILEQSQVNTICNNKDPERIKTNGCIFKKDQAVFLRNDMTADQLSYVLAHEVGHYYLEGVEEAKMKEALVADMEGIGIKEEWIPLVFPKETYEEYEKTEEILADFFQVYISENSTAKVIFPKMSALYDSLVTKNAE